MKAHDSAADFVIAVQSDVVPASSAWVGKVSLA